MVHVTDDVVATAVLGSVLGSWIIVAVVVVARYYFASRAAPAMVVETRTRRRQRPRREIPLTLHSAKIEACKGVLVKAVASPGDKCAICLDVLDNDLVRPPNCPHVYHRACIAKWIDQPPTTDRLFTCPVCAVPLISDVDDVDDVDDVSSVGVAPAVAAAAAVSPSPPPLSDAIPPSSDPYDVEPEKADHVILHVDDDDAGD